MAIIDEQTKQHLKKDFETKLKNNVKIIFVSGKDCASCDKIREILKLLDEVSNGKINIEEYDFDENKKIVEEYNVEMYPALIIISEYNKTGNIKFYGIPAGYEFISLIESIFMVSLGRTALSDNTKSIIKEIRKPVKIQVFVTPTCPHCPRAVIMAHQLAMENKNIESHMIEATEFSELSMKYHVMTVPKIVINEGKSVFEGALPEPYFVQKVIEAVNG